MQRTSTKTRLNEDFAKGVLGDNYNFFDEDFKEEQPEIEEISDSELTEAQSIGDKFSALKGKFGAVGSVMDKVYKKFTVIPMDNNRATIQGKVKDCQNWKQATDQAKFLSAQNYYARIVGREPNDAFKDATLNSKSIKDNSLCYYYKGKIDQDMTQSIVKLFNVYTKQIKSNSQKDAENEGEVPEEQKQTKQQPQSTDTAKKQEIANSQDNKAAATNTATADASKAGKAAPDKLAAANKAKKANTKIKKALQDVGIDTSVLSADKLKALRTALNITEDLEVEDDMTDEEFLEAFGEAMKQRHDRLAESEQEPFDDFDTQIQADEFEPIEGIDDDIYDFWADFFADVEPEEDLDEDISDPVRMSREEINNAIINAIAKF